MPHRGRGFSQNKAFPGGVFERPFPLDSFGDGLVHCRLDGVKLGRSHRDEVTQALGNRPLAGFRPPVELRFGQAVCKLFGFVRNAGEILAKFL